MSASQPTPNPVGPISDAPTAFGNALLAATKPVGSAPAGDLRATAALQLGWVMASLITTGTQTPLPSGFPITETTVYKARALELESLLSRVEVKVTSYSSPRTTSMPPSSWRSSYGRPPPCCCASTWCG